MDHKLTEEDYKEKVKELEKDIKKYRILNNNKNLENKQLKEDLELKTMDYKVSVEMIYIVGQKLEKMKQVPDGVTKEFWEDILRKKEILDSQETPEWTEKDKELYRNAKADLQSGKATMEEESENE